MHEYGNNAILPFLVWAIFLNSHSYIGSSTAEPSCHLPHHRTFPQLIDLFVTSHPLDMPTESHSKCLYKSKRHPSTGYSRARQVIFLTMSH